MSTSINNKKQVLRNKNIGLLNSSIDLLRNILVKENIGSYKMLDSIEGIGYVPDFYSNINNKPHSTGEMGLLGFTHLYDNEHPNSIGEYINKKYNFGDDITYYSTSLNNKSYNPYDDYNFYDEHIDYLNYNFGNGGEIKDVLNGLFTYSYDEETKKTKLLGLDSKRFSTAYSVITDILQYDNIKYAMEKTRVGTVNPDPIMSFGGVVVTNIRDYSGTDTKLGLITNQMYAHSLQNGAQFNTLRKTKYITPEVYGGIGNKMSNLSVLQSTFRIDEKTGRLMYELGNGYGTIEYHSDSDSKYDIESGNTPLYENLITNYTKHTYTNYTGGTNNYNPWNNYYLKLLPNNNQTESLEVLNYNDFVEKNKNLTYYYNDKETTDNTALYNNILHQDNDYTPFNRYGRKEDIEKWYSILNKNTNINVQYTWNDNNGTFYSYSKNGETYCVIQKDTAPLSTLTNEIIKSFKENKSGFTKNRTLISRFHTEKGENGENEKRNQFQTAVSEFGLSHGRNLLKKSRKENSDGNPYSRTWTNFHQYNSLKETIRPFTSNEETNEIYSFSDIASKLRRRNNFASNTVLNKNGLPRIAPNNDTLKEDLKKCMFSIENLAWKDIKIQDYLSPEQIGPYGGRIMWFPPYNLKFNEAVQSNWNPISFIGRGEKVWTYIDTDRSGTLSFTLLVDHPSVLNKWNIKNENSNQDKDNKEETLLRFFAGSEWLDIEKNDEENDEKNEESNEISDIPYATDSISASVVKKSDNLHFIVFFPHNFYTGTTEEDTLNAIFDEEKTAEFNYDLSGNKYYIARNVNKDNIRPEDIKEVNELPNEELKGYKYILFKNEVYVWKKETSYHTRGFLPFDSFVNDDTQILKNDIKNINITGGYTIYENDPELGIKRAKTIRSLLMNRFGIDETLITTPKSILMDNSETTSDELDDENIWGRCVFFEIEYNDMKIIKVDNIDKSESVIATNKPKFIFEGGKSATEIVTTNYINSNRVDNSDELLYFKHIEENDNFLFNKIVDRVKYFIPAFHSMTPEGFNERLGFLHQCTRQGHTFATSNQKKGTVLSAGNLAFGRPPICILRIGDFYNTKIIIQSISINYEDPALQWDMNTEGIGMQPLYANVSLNFTFLGGSDISSPISRLQNAVSFNYYANQSVYEPKADTAEKEPFRYGYNN